MHVKSSSDQASPLIFMPTVCSLLPWPLEHLQRMLALKRMYTFMHITCMLCSRLASDCRFELALSDFRDSYLQDLP